MEFKIERDHYGGNAVDEKILDQELDLLVSERPGYQPDVDDRHLILNPVGDGEFIVANHVYDDNDEFLHYAGCISDTPGTWLCWQILEAKAMLHHNFADVVMELHPLHDSHSRYKTYPVRATGRVYQNQE